MDFLNFITAIHHRLGIDIPEVDYPKLVALDGTVYYIEAKLGRVDKLNPNSDAGKQHEGGEALDQLVVAGGDTA